MKKILIFIISISVIVCGFSACTGKTKTPMTTTQPVEITEKKPEFPDEITAEKIGNTNLNNYETGLMGVIYEGLGGMYGIRSFNGKLDTGAIYKTCAPAEQYFLVSQSDGLKASNDDASTLNVFGIVDSNGKELVPMEYATFAVLSNRYVAAYKIESRTDNYEEATLFQENMYYVFPKVQEEGVMYKANWCVFDVETGKTVEGLTGTVDRSIRACGKYIQYAKGEKEIVTVDETGAKVNDSVTFFDDGSYSIDKGDSAIVYDDEDNELFKYSKNDYKVAFYIGSDCYSATKTVDGKEKYVIVNKKGEVVSTEFNSNILVDGDVVEKEGELCDFSGKKIIEGTVNGVMYDNGFRNILIVDRLGKDNNPYSTFIKPDGTELLTNKDDDKKIIDTSNFVSYREDGDNYIFYSFKDNDYTIKAQKILNSWLVIGKSDNEKACVIDTISGNKIIDGYDDYTSFTDINNRLYIYAMNQDKYDYSVDIYVVK